MITALQNLISRRGKFIFIPLLLVIVVSFVLYLSQGSSIFDFLPDGQREKMEFFGHDLNDNAQMSSLNAQNRVAADFGSSIGPVGEVMDKADADFLGMMNMELQRAFSSNSQDVDRSQLQYLFQAIQSWPYQPKRLKVRRIAMSGLFDAEFSRASVEAKLALDAQAEAWNLLPLNHNIKEANKYFSQWLMSIDPVLGIDANRSAVFESVAKNRNFDPRGIESILYSHFRAHLVEDIYTEGGFVLDEEAEIDLRINDFAWDAEALSLSLDDLEATDPHLVTLSMSALPKAGESIEITYGDKKRKFVFITGQGDANSSDVQVSLGQDMAVFSANLSESMKEQDFGFSVTPLASGSLALSPDSLRLPMSFPVFSSSSTVMSFSDEVTAPLAAFHEERKSDEVFAEPARTFATAMTFRSRDFLSVPSEPEEARLRSYFERNKESFAPPPPPPPPPPAPDSNASAGEQGPVGEGEPEAVADQKIESLALLAESNASEEIAEVTFADVREEVRQRIIDGDRIDAERDAEDLAKEAASRFLLELHQLSDDLKRKYASSYEQLRQSPELQSLLDENNVAQGKIDFSEQDMEVRGGILGLERRESEKRVNRAPLQEVASLSKSSFFTRSIRKSRDGYVIFVLDKKTEEGPGSFSSTSFSLLYREYAAQLKADALAALADRTLASLQGDSNSSVPSVGLKVQVSKKDSRLLRGYYDGLDGQVGSQLDKLEKERDLITSAERDSNATAAQLARKEVIDAEIEVIRARQAALDKESALGQKLADACQDLKPDGSWSELERTEDSVVFVCLKAAYFLKKATMEASEIEARVEDLQFARAEKGRDFVLRDLLSRESAKND
tara:strand:- start:3251 stop:5788 length:2538 start_codon:yes stop_codon:yes gene_type:complete